MAVFKFPLKKFNRKVFKVTSMSVFFKAEQLRKQPKRPVQSPGYRSSSLQRCVSIDSRMTCLVSNLCSVSQSKCLNYLVVDFVLKLIVWKSPLSQL